MTSPEVHRRRRLAVGALVLVVLGGLVLGLRTVVAPYVPGGDGCETSAGVSLTPEEAVAASRVVAGAVRAGAPVAPRLHAAGIPTSVAGAFTGRAALTYSYDADATPASTRLGPAGLTPRAAVVRRELDRVFGPQKVGGFAPGGVRTGHVPGSAHYEGRAVDVFFRPVSAASKRRGWTVAAYLVANARRLDIAVVIFDDMIWSTRRSGQGWRAYDVDTTGRSPATAAILEHRDHVHVDVV